MGCGIFNVRTDVNACDCALGCTDTVTESALEADSWRNIPCRTGESNLRQRRAGPMLYQLSYIPSLWTCFLLLLHRKQMYLGERRNGRWVSVWHSTASISHCVESVNQWGLGHGVGLGERRWGVPGLMIS